MQNNKKLFNSIIGYEEVKITLKRIVDVLENQDKYKKLGCTIPHGLFLYGPPGTGKTSIANEILSNVNRKKFIVRKNKSNGKFIDYLNGIFKQAKDHQPSIILLDDIDKFAENNHKNAEEYVVIQSLIDDVKLEDIFIIATANEEYLLPASLVRSGRFDIQIEIGTPDTKDSYKIIEYYLKKKKIDKDVNIKNLSYILDGSSCAELESITNKAGMYAGFKNKTSIGMIDLIIASLELKYDSNVDDLNKEDKYTIYTAYHEAGHALISELLEKGSVSFVTVARCHSNIRGYTCFINDDNYFDDINFMINRAKCLLAGKAAIEVVYNKCDVGCNSDLKRVYDIARRFIDNYCMEDFNSWYYNSDETSEKTKQSKDDSCSRLITNYYNEVKGMLIANRHILDMLANELKNKKILFKEEIEDICNKTYGYKEMVTI